MLRTHKLGEADRIITLLTRSHGRVRAVAKGVRRTTSRFGSRLEPFTHVDLQLAEGRSLDTITQAETLTPFSKGLGARLRPLHRRHRDARDRRPAGRRGAAAVGAAVPAAGGRAAGDGRGGARARPGARLLPAALAVGGRLRAVVRARARGAAHRGAAPVVQPVDGRGALRDLPGAGVGQPGAGDRRAARRAARRRLGGRRRRRAAAPQGGQRPGGGVPRLAPRARPQSLAYVER